VGCRAAEGVALDRIGDVGVRAGVDQDFAIADAGDEAEHVGVAVASRAFSKASGFDHDVNVA
jgi:hypothetical protein